MPAGSVKAAGARAMVISSASLSRVIVRVRLSSPVSGTGDRVPPATVICDALKPAISSVDVWVSVKAVSVAKRAGTSSKVATGAIESMTIAELAESDPARPGAGRVGSIGIRSLSLVRTPPSVLRAVVLV